ncbi:hypothetical protein [Mesorhizobium sp. M0139]|uniref:hypothetical protein n=1 Tax=Mesorhizobium sp. M0139 TaxID=2956892 RepID=UPI003335DC9C
MAAFDLITLYPSAAVATSGTMTFTYPTGNASRYSRGSEVLIASGLMDTLTVGAGKFSLVYGASSVVVTYLGSTSIPAGSKVVLHLPLAEKVGVSLLAINLNLADIATGDLITNYVPGFAFRIIGIDWRTIKPATTAAKLATLNLEIGTTDLTGGLVALTSANCTPAGAAVAGTDITGAFTGTATDSISLEASAVTAFVEGNGVLVIKLQNLDSVNEIAAK